MERPTLPIESAVDLMRYDQLDTVNGDLVRLVVETPRGSTAKIAYDPASGVFEYSRALPLGLSYPYDWGFIPSTLGEDGDPLDGLVIHGATTAPGVVIKCDLLGCLAVRQQNSDGMILRNDRFILWPHPADAPTETNVCKRLRGEIEEFFEAAVAGTGKQLIFEGWLERADAWARLQEGQSRVKR
ncbi:MAG TPA: inorganic diphosphatase [Rhizobiaceae bacterium]|nr:inorganic diphosphatase [Rhizobiaceae bacterium]